MKKVEVAIHTWILKFSGILESEHPLESSDSADEISVFRDLYEKSKTQKLNEDEWTKFKKAMSAIAEVVLQAADVILATTIQSQTDLLKNIVFQHVIIDETSVLTHAELLCAWRGTEVITLIGDVKQLPTTVLSTSGQNPFAGALSYGPFQRFADLGLRVFVLRHVMRMSAGLEDVCNQIFYDAKLICGPGTSPTDPKRHLSNLIQGVVQDQYRLVKKAPADLVYPVFVDIPGVCRQERNGSSRVNMHNISFIVDLIRGLREELAEEDYRLESKQIGIASPYAAQVRATRQALHRAGIFGIQVGVTESWQGSEADVMIVDLVRAKNPDLGALGFLTKKARLNVLLSCQRQFLFVVGDMKCCESSFEPIEALEPADYSAKKQWGLDERKNAWVVKVFKWFSVHGRVVEVSLDNLSEDYVTFQEEGEEDEKEVAGGWVDDEDKQKEDGEEQEGQGEDAQEAKEEDTAWNPNNFTGPATGSSGW